MPIVKYRRDKVSAGDGWWSDKQRYEAVAAYLLVGNLAQVARYSGIPEVTLRKWKASPWWGEAELEIKRGSKVELSGKLRKSIELSQQVIEDRLLNGDFVFNPKTGQVVRRPVSVDSAVKVLDRLVDKQLLLEKAADSHVAVTQEGVTERLAKIADELLKFAKAKDVTPNPDENTIIDVEPVQVSPESTEEHPESSGAEAPESPGQDQSEDR